MEHRIKENTLMTKQNIFYHHIVPYLGEMKLDEITPKDIIHWQDQVMKDNNYKQITCIIYLNYFYWYHFGSS